MSTEQTTEVVEKIGDKLVQYMDAAESIVTQYAGDAADLGLMVFRIEAISKVLLPLVALAIFIIVAMKYLPTVHTKIGQTFDNHPGYGALWLLIVVPIVVSLIQVCNIWAWVGMFYPEAYAVHLLLLK